MPHNQSSKADFPDPEKVWRADWVISMDKPVLYDGYVKIQADRIIETGVWDETVMPEKKENYRHFPGGILLPGLINAHCHLELTHLKGKIAPGLPFAEWIMELQKVTRNWDQKDFQQSVLKGAGQLLSTGTTVVADIGNSLANLSVLPQTQLSGIIYCEVLGLEPRAANQRMLQKKSQSEWITVPEKWRFTFTCHSPYSCNVDLFRQVANESHPPAPFSLHLAESLEEKQFFQNASGRLWEFCRAIFPEITPPAQKSPVEWLKQEKLLPDGSMIIHGNLLENFELEWLAEKKVSLVHCPKSSRFFGHPEFPLEKVLKSGVPICLGTDSLASNENLDMFEEMAVAKIRFPDWNSLDIMKAVTINPAAAMGLQKQNGKLARGFRADVVAVEGPKKFKPNEANIYDWVVGNCPERLEVMASGKVIASH